jgi:hypothetical protein
MPSDPSIPTDDFGVPTSLRRKSKEPKKPLQFNVPLSWWEELTELAREYDQDVSTFLREATEDWLKRARKAQNCAGDLT